METAFISRQPVVRQISINIPPPRRNATAGEDYTGVFLSHARLYVFAEKYDKQLLRQLALDELHQMFSIFTSHKERTGDIIALLLYVYDPDNTGESREGVEDLRTLMMIYMGFQMNKLMKDKEFHKALESNGGLLKDYMKIVAKRI